MSFRSILVGMCPLLGLAVQPARAAGQAIRLTDDAGREVELDASPVRIVSLVPVATEVLFALGAGGRIVGRSRYDDYPPEALAIPSVGDAIRPAMEEVLLKDPDLVILVGGSDNASAVRELADLGVPYLVVRFNTLADLQANVVRLGLLVGREEEATGMWSGIDADLTAVSEAVAGRLRPRVYYDLGYPPAFTVGSGSYLDTLITIAGGRNVFHDLAVPAARVSLEAILARDPDVIVRPLQNDSGSPTAPLVSRPGWEHLRAVKNRVVVPVPADLVHRLGPRVGQAAMALARALHPDLGGSE